MTQQETKEALDTLIAFFEQFNKMLDGIEERVAQT